MKQILKAVLIALFLAVGIVFLIDHLFAPFEELKSRGRNEIWPVEITLLGLLACAFAGGHISEWFDKLFERLLGPHENQPEIRRAAKELPPVTPSMLLLAFVASMFIYFAAVALFRGD